VPTKLTLLLLVAAAGITRAATTPGTTPGQVTVNPDGAAGYSINFIIPPGTAGVQPSLGMTYSSRGGPSALGFGWSLSGLSSIQRGPRNLVDDGQVRGIWMDAKDAFFLDGQKLVLTSEKDGVKEYRSRIDNYARVRAFDWNTYGPDRFEVQTKAGLTMLYGSKGHSQIRLSSGVILTWLCDEIRDSNGNYFQYTYTSNGIDYRLVRADYTGNAKAAMSPYANVVFEYEDVGPYEMRFVAGQKVEPRFRLKEVRSSFGNSLLRRYTMAYEGDKARKCFLLISLSESGADGVSYPPLHFEYSKSVPLWQDQDTLALPVDFAGATSGAGFRFIDVDGDHRRDVLFRSTLGGTTKAAAFIRPATGPLQREDKWNPPADFARDTGRNQSVVIADLDQDGKDEILVSDDTGPGEVYTSTSMGWTALHAPPPFKFSNHGTPDRRYILVDLDPAQHNGMELLWYGQDGGSINRGAARFTGGAWVSLPSYAPPLPFAVDTDGRLLGVYAIDVNCDGKLDLVYHRRINGVTTSAAYSHNGTAWQQLSVDFALPFDPVPHSSALRVLELGGSTSCKDVLFAYRKSGATYRGAYISTSTGWICACPLG
jgi:hypothetical protein